MTKEQEEKFNVFRRSYIFEDYLNAARDAWQACLEANGIGEDRRNPPKAPCGHDSNKPCECELNRDDERYRIGEEVEYKFFANDPWKTGKIAIIDETLEAQGYGDVRRKPAWTPKEGEAVFANNNGDVLIARVSLPFSEEPGYDLIFQDGDVCRGDTWQIKPFDASKIGRPWDEI